MTDFNIGDEVEVCVDLPEQYPITREGSRGVVVSRVNAYGWAAVEFHSLEGPYKDKHTVDRHKYEIDVNHLKLVDSKGMSPIERKIKRMYERQPYFSRYRSGQPSWGCYNNLVYCS